MPIVAAAMMAFSFAIDFTASYPCKIETRSEEIAESGTAAAPISTTQAFVRSWKSASASHGDVSAASSANPRPTIQERVRAVERTRPARNASPRARAAAIMAVTPFPRPRVASGTRTAVSVESCARSPVPWGPSSAARTLARRMAARTVAAEPIPSNAVD